MIASIAARHIGKDDHFERYGMSERATFAVRQRGQQVAMVEGPVNRAWGEAQHYAALYAQEGPVEIWKRVKGRWKLCNAPAASTTSAKG